MPPLTLQTQTRLFRFALFVAAAVALAIGGIYYHALGRPDYSPVQPVAFSHQIHAGKLGMDCSACHTGVALSPLAGIPDAQSCLDCHRLVKRDSPAIEPLLRAADRQYPGYTGEPIAWVRVNRLADHARFNHQAHVTRGVSCTECHGDVASMERVSIPQNRGMRWCLECHRNPGPRLRPVEETADPSWDAAAWLRDHDIRDNEGHRITIPDDLGPQLQRRWSVRPKTDCTSCHQ